MKAFYLFKTGFLLLSLLTAESIKAEDRLRERIYIQTDKQIYLSGEQLWMKLYLTDSQGKPQTLSKIGYVELIDDKAPQIQQKIEIENGIGYGMIMLPAQLPTGYYRFVAYTRYMQNEGETVYFQKYVGIVNTLYSNSSIRTDTSLYVKPTLSDKENLSVTSAMDVYPTRTQSEIRIEGLPDNVHSLAVSVVGEEFIPVPDDEMTITDWHQRLSGMEAKNFQLNLLPEYEGLILNGQLVDAQTGELTTDKPGLVLGFSGEALRVSGGNLDDSGQVSFYTGMVSGRHRLGIAFFPTPIAFFLPAPETRYSVKLQSPFAAHTIESLPRFALNPLWEEKLLQRSVGVQVMYSFLLDSFTRQAKEYLSHIRWKPDYSYLLDEYTRFDRMNVMFTEFIPYLVLRTVDGKRQLYVRTADYAIPSGKSLILLDGIPVNDADFLYNLNTRLLKRVDVYQGQLFIAGHVFEGIGSFISFDNNAPGLRNGDYMQLEEYEGTQPVHRFYAPSYMQNNSLDERRRMPDYRHTLLWEPDLQTKGQNTVVIPFSTSDINGDYRITVEGITGDGQPLRGIARFQVGEAGETGKIGETALRKLKIENGELKIEEAEEDQLISYSVNQLFNQATDTVAAKDHAVAEEILPAQPVVQQLQPAEKAVEVTSQTIYYAIIGSFSSETRANQFMQQINMPELTNMGIVISDGRFRVYAAKFDNREDAQSYILRLRTNEKLKDAWLFVGQ